jgi:hypothetical protein
LLKAFVLIGDWTFVENALKDSRLEKYSGNKSPLAQKARDDG